MSYQIKGRQKGSAVGDMLMPVNGLRGAQQRAGITPRNHMKDNRMALVFAQRKAKEEREMAAHNNKGLYKLEQFRDVQARVYDAVPASPRRTANREDAGDEDYSKEADSDTSRASGADGYLVKGASEQRRQNQMRKAAEARQVIEDKIQDARYIADRPNTPRKGATPKHDEYGVFKAPSNEDFIRHNRRAAKEMEAKATYTKRENAKANAAVHESFGRIPDYLQARKEQMARDKEEERRRAPDPNCPRGMKLMPEEERVQTLEVLKSSREEAIHQLSKMPFILETPTAKRKHAELEMKLKEIEAALVLFSKQKVYIADAK